MTVFVVLVVGLFGLAVALPPLFLFYLALKEMPAARDAQLRWINGNRSPKEQAAIEALVKKHRARYLAP